MSSKTNLKRNFSKMTFRSESSSERLTLSEKMKMTSRSRSKENNNQALRERSSTSINQHKETENNKTLELKVQQLVREFSLLKQKMNLEETENISFKRHLSPFSPPLPSPKKQNNLNTHQETKNVHAASASIRSQEKVSTTQILKFLH